MPGADPGPSQPKLLDRVRAAIRARHYSRRTEQAYVAWIRRYIVFHKKTHPAAMGAREVTAFLSWLASAKRVSASTQNQALSAVVFLYRHVLGIEVGTVEDVVRAKTPRRLPVVLTREEVGAVLKHLDGTMWMAGVLLYGAGLRLHECLDLRAKDVDFERNQLTICRGKGQKDRVTMLPVVVKVPLTEHLAAVRRQHAKDLERGAGRAPLPFAAFTALVSKRSHNVSALGRLSAGGFSCGWNGSTPLRVAPDTSHG